MESERHTALRRLEHAAKDGRVSALCREFSADLLVVFGSAVANSAAPHDLDLAARFEDYPRPNTLVFLDRLAEIADSDALDFVTLNAAGPVIKERALFNPLVLFEARPGVWANAQIAAMLERMETEKFRDDALELMLP